MFNFDASLHKSQLEVFNDPQKFQVLVCGRRFGKSHLQVTKHVIDCLMFPKLMPGYNVKQQTMETAVLVGMPTLKQARKILWKPLVKTLENCPYVDKISRSDYTIRFKGNRPDIILAGLNDNAGDRARGLKLWRVCIDEVQDVRPSVIDAVIIPAMADTPHSRALFTGTPKGKNNHLYNLFTMERDNDDWKSYNFPTWTNPLISKDEVERARKRLSPRLFSQEFEAHFVNFEGQFFTEFDRETHVISEFPQHIDRVIIGHDCGDVNPAYVSVAQCGDKFIIVDAKHLGDGRNAIALDVVIRTIDKACHRFGERTKKIFVDPSRPAVVMDMRRKLTHPSGKYTVTAWNPIIDGIDLLNNLFFQDRLFIHESVGDSFIEELESYHRKRDKNDNILNAVADGQVDHRVDSLRYAIATLYKGSKNRY